LIHFLVAESESSNAALLHTVEPDKVSSCLHSFYFLRSIFNIVEFSACHKCVTFQEIFFCDAATQRESWPHHS